MPSTQLLVSSLDQFTPNGRCKLCKLIKYDKAVWLRAHDYLVREGHSLQKVANWLNEQLEVLNPTLSPEDRLAPITKVNLSHHLRKHVKAQFRTQRKLQESMTPKNDRQVCHQVPSDLIAEGASLIKTLKDSADLDGYRSLISAVETVQQLFDARRAEIAAGGSSISVAKITQTQKLAESLFSLHHDLLKYRNDARLSRLAVQSAIELAGVTFANALNELTPDVFGDENQEQLEELRKRLAEKMAYSSREILNRVINDFNMR